jgi:hypothetical protein
MSWVWNVMGESTYVLMGSCSQNTFRNERLEHHGCKQERNFNDREKMIREMHSGVWKLCARELWSGNFMYIYVRLSP